MYIKVCKTVFPVMHNAFKHIAVAHLIMHTSLWPPYVIRQAIIFLPCGFFFLLQRYRQTGEDRTDNGPIA